MDEFSALDATAQAQLVASGQVSPLELVEAALERIERVNPQLNAVISVEGERACHEARSGELPDGPLRGVPFLIKEIGATQAGLRQRLGNRALAELDHRSTSDTVLGARFRRAGLVTVGTTNLPELGTCPTTQPLGHGPTNNPWDLTRSPAGSSGGSAAAVAAGLVPVAHANDGGGSTRLPAAWCGLVGLKTSRGRVPNPTNPSRLTSELVVSRTVRDTATVLDAVHGSVEGDLYACAPPARSYVAELGASVAPLRVAMITDAGAHELDPSGLEGVQRTARVLEEMGHRVEPVSSAALLGGDSSVNGRLWMANIARRVQALGELAGRALTEDEVDPYNWTAAVRGADLLATELAEATERQQLWSVGFIEWMSAWDLLLTPTAGCPPLLTAELEPDPERPWRMGRTYARIGVFTLPFNVTGQPAISLPLHETADGLPVGIQLVAHLGREDLLIALAAQLEQAMPWAARVPPSYS